MKNLRKKTIQFGICLIPVLLISNSAFAATAGTIAAGGDSLWQVANDIMDSGYGALLHGGLIGGAMWIGYEGKYKAAIAAFIAGEGIFAIPGFVAPTGFTLQMLGA